MSAATIPPSFDRVIALLAEAQREAQAGLQRHGWPVQAPTPQQAAREAVQRAQGAKR